MWEFAAQHPGWALGYLVVICFTVSMVSAQIASAWRAVHEGRRKGIRKVEFTDAPCVRLDDSRQEWDEFEEGFARGKPEEAHSKTNPKGETS
jgi:hypothetical protein